MAHRSPARWLAPIALLVALAAVGLVYQSTTEDKTSSSKPSSSTDGKTGTSTGRTSTAKTEGKAGPKTYRVKSGDTLGAIAESTGVPVIELQELNPDLDASSLSVGQRIRLRR
jgi:LysM repeat protein